ncbi:MAG: glycosyltransferase family 4 protein, partial [Bacteroidales bacterium]|nr:glycosyltransferase family 4 protein [Bacteroidales bacterium]
MDYYNPLHFFDEMYLLSPLEEKERYEFGMNIIPTNQKQLKSRVRDLNIDVVRAYGGYWACDMACNNKVKNVPVVVSVHDTNLTLLYNSIKRADVIFCVSEAVKKLVLTKNKKPDKVWILPNRVNFAIMRPYLRNKFKDLDNKYSFKFKILHVGRKSKQKNLDTLIKTLKILGNEYCIIAIGVGETNEYVKLAVKEGVREQCYFIDMIPNSELPIYYSWADCICIPSRWEGFGIVFIEALACESIVVTSDIAPMNEYIEHMKNGLLVRDYENPQSVAEVIKAVCNTEQLREYLKKNTRKSVEKFAKSKIDKLEVNYYKKILIMNQNNEFNL